MAGHPRTEDTGQAHRAASGRIRRTRVHLPPEQLEQARRTKQYQGARAIADKRIAQASDPVAKLQFARAYLLSALAKYRPSGDHLDAAIAAVLAAGDQVFLTGEPLSPAARDTRRRKAADHRGRRADAGTRRVS
ncbi:MAG TPA: hypothetical protein VGL02_08260 [Streptomyces sp.]